MISWNLGFSPAAREESDYMCAVAAAYAKMLDADVPFAIQRFIIELCKSKSDELKISGLCGRASLADLFGRLVNLAMSKMAAMGAPLMGTDIDGLEFYINGIESYVDLCKEEAKAVVR